MQKFIEVHSDGMPMLVNLRHVEGVIADGGHSVLLVHGSTQEVDEPYPKLRTIIASTQGGLPMEPTKPY